MKARKITAWALDALLIACLLCRYLPAHADAARSNPVPHHNATAEQSRPKVPHPKAPHQPRVVVLTLVTVPGLPSARFSFDGKPVSVDQKGVARLPMPSSRAPHTLTLLTPSLTNDAMQAQFVRWWAQHSQVQAYKTTFGGLVLRHSLRIQVAFRVSYLVHYQFVDQSHDPVSPRRIESVTIRSDTGVLLTAKGSGVIRLIGYRPRLEGSTLAEKQTIFSLENVMIDGSNVVHSGQQRFRPSQKQSLTFVVLLKQIHITAFDWLFGTPIGRAIVLTYPDGKQQRISFGQGHQVVIDHLARGDYKVHVIAHGLNMSQPVALSRNQSAQVMVISYSDMAAGLAVAVIILLGFLLAGKFRGGKERARKATEARA